MSKNLNEPVALDIGPAFHHGKNLEVLAFYLHEYTSVSAHIHM